MTDERQSGTEWVPGFGMLEVPRERAELIRGLFELAAFVADHPEVPVPAVTACVPTRYNGWDAEWSLVADVAAALGVEAEFRAGGGHYQAERLFGPVRTYCLAITPEHMAAYEAWSSYRGLVQPVEDVAAGESR